MNRRLLLLVSSPALLLGIALLAACTASAAVLHSLQARMAQEVNTKLAGLRAARDMEIALRDLRFNGLVNTFAPSAESRRAIAADHEEFEKALIQARAACVHEQTPTVESIRQCYEAYRKEIEASEGAPKQPGRQNLLNWVHDHPLRRVVAPCQELAEANETVMDNLLRSTADLGRTTQFGLLALGLLGPLGGAFCGLAIARTLSRSIARLQVRVQDVSSQLAPEVGTIDVQVNSDLEGLNDQMASITQSVQDLVERLQTHQREMARAEQLALVGQLAGGIAHEIRNPLTAMKWLVDDAIRSYPGETMPLQDLQVLQSEIDRMKQTVQGLLDFVRVPELKPRRADMRDLVRQALELVRARKRQLGVTCTLDLPPQPAWANVDPAQVKSVLVNLLLNALDAMPNGGRLRVALSRSDGQLRLAVEDTGSGIPPELLDRLFTSFVSTKPTGTGLGLSTSRRLVEQHGGQLRAENRTEGGARFVMTLPIA